MRIKIGKQKEQKKSSISNIPYNPEPNLCIETRPGVLFQSQFKSIHNYFTLLHRIFGRDAQAKSMLIDLSKNRKETLKFLQQQPTNIADDNQNDSFTVKLMRGTSVSEIHHYPQHTISNHQKYHLHKPKWKDSIIRRKNNGSHGEIMKGNARENHSRLMNRINLTEPSPEEPQTSKEKIIRQQFVPIGSGHFNQTDKQSPINNKTKKSRFTPKPKVKVGKTYRKKEQKSDRKRWRDEDYNQMMSRTGFPVQLSIKASQNMTTRKSMVRTPNRYKSRMSTPCPWDHNSQR